MPFAFHLFLMTSGPSDRGFDMSGPQKMDNEVTRLKVHIKLHNNEKAAISLVFAICPLSVTIW